MEGGRLADHYAAVQKLREMTATLKKNQEYRGLEGLKARMAERSKRTTWRQMKGMQLAMHEINHPGNQPFMIGLGITCSLFLYAYFAGRNSAAAQEESKYYQRFLAKPEHH